MAQPETAPQPVKRFDKDGQPIEPSPGVAGRQQFDSMDEIKERTRGAYREEASELEGLTAFNERIAAWTGGAPDTMAEGREGVNTAIGDVVARAKANVEASKLTPAEIQAKAIASELAPLLTKDESPSVDDVLEAGSYDESEQYDEPTAEADTTVHPWYDDAEDVFYEQYSDGTFVTDAEGDYTKHQRGSAAFGEYMELVAEAQGVEPEEDEEYED